MPVLANLNRFVLDHPRSVGAMGLLLVGSLCLFLALNLQRQAVDDLKLSANQLRRQISMFEANLTFFRDSREWEAEVGALLAAGTKEATEALATIPVYASILDIGSVTYDLGDTQLLWESNTELIEQTELRLQVEALHEGQIFDFLDTLESRWGGRFFIERLEFARASEGDLGIMADVALQWRKLRTP